LPLLVLQIDILKYKLKWHIVLLIETFEVLYAVVSSFKHSITQMALLLIHFFPPNNHLKHLPMFSAMDMIPLFHYFQLNMSSFVLPRKYVIHWYTEFIFMLYYFSHYHIFLITFIH